MKIDFVILWVDGQDQAWLKERERFLSSYEKKDNGISDNRFRDWDLLRYWFRGVEKFAPWVNRIHFVTWGHVPSWLNTDHPKLRLVRHDEFMPEDCLPTFNSNAIEVNVHRIPGLGPHFVMFNDDMYLINHVKENDFYCKGKPCDSVLMDAPAGIDYEDIFPHILVNNAGILNTHFKKKQVLRRNFRKFYSLRYGKNVLRNILVSPFERFTGFRSHHNPVPHRKKTFEEVWKLEGQALMETSRHRFRHRDDVSHWLFRDWQFCKGQFVPRSTRSNRCFELGLDSMEDICLAIEKQEFQTICLNDSYSIQGMESMKKQLKESFDHILCEECSYER